MRPRSLLTAVASGIAFFSILVIGRSASAQAPRAIRYALYPVWQGNDEQATDLHQLPFRLRVDSKTPLFLLESRGSDPAIHNLKLKNLEVLITGKKNTGWVPIPSSVVPLDFGYRPALINADDAFYFDVDIDAFKHGLHELRLDATVKARINLQSLSLNPKTGRFVDSIVFHSTTFELIMAKGSVASVTAQDSAYDTKPIGGLEISAKYRYPIGWFLEPVTHLPGK